MKTNPEEGMGEPVISIRRLQPHELDLVRDAQKFSPGFGKRFRQHKKWLNRVLGDLQEGIRIAFGAFASAADELDHFLGSVVLKRGHSGVIEAKNLLVRCDSSTFPAQTIQRALMSRVEAFCRRRGFSRIELEIFSHNADSHEQSRSALNLALTNGYGLQSVRPSDLFHRDSLYSFTKHLQPLYVGDSEDYVRLSRWVLEDRLAFVDVSQPELIWLPDQNASVEKHFGYAYCYTFSVPYSGQAFRITGVCVVDLGHEDDVDPEIYHKLLVNQGHGLQIENPELLKAIRSANVRVLLSFSRKARNPQDPLVWWLGSNEIIGPDANSQPRGEEIGGVILEIDQELFKERIGFEKSFSYFVTNGLGHDLFSEIHDHSGSRPLRNFYALLVSVGRDGDRRACVWGVAQLSTILVYSTRTAYYSVGEVSPLWKPDEYRFYVNDFTVNQDINRVYVLKLGPVAQLKSSIPIPTILGQAAPENPDEVGLPTCYVSVKAIKGLQKQQAHKEAFREALEKAERFQVDAGDSHPLVTRVTAMLAEALDVIPTAPPDWFHSDPNQPTPQIHQLVKLLKKRLAESDPSVNRPRQSPKGLSLFDGLNNTPAEDPVGLLLNQADSALAGYQLNLKSGKTREYVWRLRFAVRTLFDSSYQDLELNETQRNEIKTLFPNREEVKLKLKLALATDGLDLLPTDQNSNDRNTMRRRLIEEDIGLSSSEFASQLQIGDNQDFVYAFLGRCEELGQLSAWVMLVKAIAGTESGKRKQHRFEDMAAAGTALQSDGADHFRAPALASHPTSASQMLSGQDRAIITELMLNGFNRQELDHEFRTHFNLIPGMIPEGKTIQEFVENAVDWFDRRSQLMELVKAVIHARPATKPRLGPILEQLQSRP